MCVNSVFIHPYNNNVKLKVPCGHCASCRADNVTLWTNRIQSELTKYRSSFVTFTYDELHLPFSKVDSLFPTLNKVQFQNFQDSLRHIVKKLPVMPTNCTKNYKYLAVGEYGDSFKRPHYHVLYMGLDFADFSRFFEHYWHYGSVKSLPCNLGTILYTLDYMNKSINGPLAEEKFDNFGIERPFLNVSKGVGFDFFLNHSEEINNTGFIQCGSRVCSVPHYFKKMFTRFDQKSIDSRSKFLKKVLGDYDSILEANFHQKITYKNRFLLSEQYEKQKMHITFQKAISKGKETNSFLYPDEPSLYKSIESDYDFGLDIKKLFF